MTAKSHSAPAATPVSIDEAAAAWHLRLSTHDPSALERQEFETWLQESPEHRAAYDSMVKAWEAAGAEAGDAAILQMREAALRFQAPRRPSWILPASLVATAAIGAVWLYAWIYLSPNTQNSSTLARATADRATVADRASTGEYQTAVGERAVIRLIDGSVVTLDTASKVSVSLLGQEREVHLLAGRANFEVAKDKIHPFVVYAADRRITAVGTAFDVRLNTGEVRVTLVEGKVAVDQLARGPKPQAADSPPARTLLDAGEQLIAAVGGAAKVRGADVGRQTSWREGRLVFEADRLADAVEEMNRYSNAPIVFADPAIGDLKVSGVFGTSNPRAFVRALTEYFSVEADDNGDATVLRWRR